MDSKSYADAMATINAADKDTLAQTADIASALKTALDDAREKFQAIVDGYGSVDGPVIGARATVQSMLSQLASLDYTIQNMTQMSASALSQYMPAPTPIAPLMPVAPSQ